MKRLLFALCVLCPLVMEAQYNYEIYRINGDVTLRRAKETLWINADVLVEVSLNDVVNVNKGGEVSIVEKSTGRIFSSKEIGAFTVKERLQNAENAAQNLFSALNKELVNSVRKQKSSNNKYESYAASANSVRGGIDGTYSVYDTLYANIVQCAGEEKCAECSDITLVIDTLSDNAFTISVGNGGEKDLYCSLVLVAEGWVSLCYYFREMDFIPLTAGTILDLSPFPLIRNEGAYVFVVSERDLSVDYLETVFEGERILQPCELKGVRTIKL